VSEQPSRAGDAQATEQAAQPGRVIPFTRGGKGGTRDRDERPEIEIRVGEIPRMVRQTIAALATDPNLFQRGGELVTITRQPEREEIVLCAERGSADHSCSRCGADVSEICAVDFRRGSNIITRPGTPIVRPIGATLTERAAESADWIKWDPKAGEHGPKERAPGMMVPANPDPATMRIVSTREDYPGVRPMRAVIETPAIAPSGRAICAPGYDRETAFFMLPAFEMDPIPEFPTQAEAAEALRYLWIEPYSDFPFADVGEPDADDIDRTRHYEKARKVPGAFVGIAAILSVLARPAIIGAVPGFVFEAATQGSGKSMQMHLTSLLTTGRPAGVMTFPMKDGTPNEEELEKVLSGYALGGARLISFDNIVGNLGGPALDKVLTAVETIDLRKLGESSVMTMPWAAVTQYSGNNMTMSPDVSRRSMISRLVSPHESPSKRPASDFRHPRLLAWVRANLPKLVRAALVVLRAYIVAKDKSAGHCGERGGFEEWSGLVPCAIKYAGGPNVIDAWAEEEMAVSGGDEMSAAHSMIMASWPFETPVKAAEVLSWAFKNEFEISRGAAHDGLEDVRDAIRTICKCQGTAPPKSVVFGIALAKLRQKIRDGKCLERSVGPKKATLWIVKGGGRKATPEPAPDAVPATVSAEPVATPPSVAVGTTSEPPVMCQACITPRGRGPGKCDPCATCAGCLTADRTWAGSCGCGDG
jgi:hypothetical protein